MVFILMIVICTACSRYKPQKIICELQDVKTIFFDGTSNIRYGEVYAHYVLLKGFSRVCLDSTTIVNIALKYIDTIKRGKPIEVIKLFSSNKDFIPNEHSQVMEEINKSCLVTIGLNLKTKMPEDFIFYNDQGQIIYIGNKWKVNGDNRKPIVK